MSIMSVVSEDVKPLVKDGFDDKTISKIVDMDLSYIQNIINYFRTQFRME